MLDSVESRLVLKELMSGYWSVARVGHCLEHWMPCKAGRALAWRTVTAQPCSYVSFVSRTVSNSYYNLVKCICTYKFFINVWAIYKFWPVVWVYFPNYIRRRIVTVFSLLTLMTIFCHGGEVQMQGFLVSHRRCALLAWPCSQWMYGLKSLHHSRCLLSPGVRFRI